MRAPRVLFWVTLAILGLAPGSPDSRAGPTRITSLSYSIVGDVQDTGFAIVSLGLLSDRDIGGFTDSVLIRVKVAPEFAAKYSLLAGERNVRILAGKGELRAPVRLGTAVLDFKAINSSGNIVGWGLKYSVPARWVSSPECENYSGTWESVIAEPGTRIAARCRPSQPASPGGNSWSEDLPDVWVSGGAEVHSSETDEEDEKPRRRRKSGRRAAGENLSEIRKAGSYESFAAVKFNSAAVADAKVAMSNAEEWWGLGTVQTGRPIDLDFAFSSERTHVTGSYKTRSWLPSLPRLQFALGGELFGSTTSQLKPLLFVDASLPISGGRFEAVASAGLGLSTREFHGLMRFHPGLLGLEGGMSERRLSIFLDGGVIYLNQSTTPDPETLTGLLAPELGAGLVWRMGRAWRASLDFHGGLVKSSDVDAGLTKTGPLFEGAVRIDWVPRGTSRNLWFLRGGRQSVGLPQIGSFARTWFEVGWGFHAWPSGSNRWGLGS